MKPLTFITSLALSIGIATALTSCQSGNTAPLAGSIQAQSSEADQLIQKAARLKASGKTTKAAKTYGKAAKKYPFDAKAAEARKEQGELLEAAGRPLKAFEAYQELITRYPGSQHYNTVLERQKAIAQATAEGQIKNNFLGLKSKIDRSKTIDMLAKVRQNAPRAESAPKAQYTIGSLYQSGKKYKEAIASYNQLVRDHPSSNYAGEGMFQIGKIYLEDSARGNQDTANMNRAREAFEDFTRNYPKHPKANEARQSIAKLKSDGLLKNFEVAEFYYQKNQPQSAVFYYKEVMRLTNSGELYNRAKARIAELGAQ